MSQQSDTYYAQLVTLLTTKGRLAGDEPFNVFNNTMSAKVREGAGGPTTCVARGSPVRHATTTMGGGFDDVVVNVAAADVSASYQPGPGTGWATIGQAGYSVLSATLQLVNLLYQKGVLAGTEPYDVFNNGTRTSARLPFTRQRSRRTRSWHTWNAVTRAGRSWLTQRDSPASRSSRTYTAPGADGLQA